MHLECSPPCLDRNARWKRRLLLNGKSAEENTRHSPHSVSLREMCGGGGGRKGNKEWFDMHAFASDGTHCSE